MKAAAFAYERPDDLAATLELLEDPQAKLLAGGQSLVPMMALRLARPKCLVDLARVEELTGVEDDDGSLRVGATVRQRALERRPGLSERVPLLAAVLPHVGHRENRNRGTVGGSVAHADPSAELPLVAAVLAARLTACGPDGERELGADDFFTGPFQTRLEPGELLTELRFPIAQPGDGFAFDEVARRHGDYALCGVAVHVDRRGGEVRAARVGLLAVGGKPLVFDVAAELGGTDGAVRFRAVADSVAAQLEPGSDVHASAGYRMRLARVLVARCLERAWADAGERA
jgi:2-furoyl-CoA dehydrogenase FAD binding subunit